MTIDTLTQPRPTKEQIVAALMACKAIADTIRELSPVPSGTLYASVCGKMDLPTYQRVIGTLKGAGIVREQGHLLTWCGPTH